MRIVAQSVQVSTLMLLALPRPVDALPDPPPDGSYARVTVDGGASPFLSVSYDITIRGGTLVLSLVKESLCLKGQQDSVRLIGGESAAAIISDLENAGVWSVAAPPGAVEGRASERPAPRDSPRYEFWSARGRSMTRFSVDQKTLLASPALLGAVMAIRDAVRSRVPPLPMRDVYHASERMGYLSMTATEPAQVLIDGWEPAGLPLEAVELAEGEHTVVVRTGSGRVREFKVRIAAGLTSQVHVVFDGN